MPFALPLDDLVDLRLARHGVLDRGLRRVVVELVNLFVVGRFPVDEDAADDHIVVGLLLGNHPVRHAVDDRTSDGLLGRAEHLHRLLRALDRDLRDHHGRGFADQIRRNHGQQATVAGALIRERAGERDADRAGLVADQ